MRLVTTVPHPTPFGKHHLLPYCRLGFVLLLPLVVRLLAFAGVGRLPLVLVYQS